MPHTASSGPQANTFTLSANQLLRSDKTQSRPRQFIVQYGFVPQYNFSSGLAYDDGGVTTTAWFSPVNTSVALTITIPSTMNLGLLSTWSNNKTQKVGLFSDFLDLPNADVIPGGIRAITDSVVTFVPNSTALGNALHLSLNVSNLPPGQYPITFSQGVLVDTLTNLKNTRVTVVLHVGFPTSWSVLDLETGDDVTNTLIDATANLGIVFTLDAYGSPAALAGVGAAASQGLTTALPTWSSLVNAETLAHVRFSSALPLSTHTPLDASIIYPLSSLLELCFLGTEVSCTSPSAATVGNYYVASIIGGGSVCNGLEDTERVCNAQELGSGFHFSVGLRLIAGVYDASAGALGSTANRYYGALNAEGTAPASPADAPIPCLAPAVSIMFSFPSTAAPTAVGSRSLSNVAAWWGTALIPSTPLLPTPSSISVVTITAGSHYGLAFTWADSTVIPTGSYDVTLLARMTSWTTSGGVADNMEVSVKLVMGFDVTFWTADTSIDSAQDDSVQSAPLPVGEGGFAVTSATDVVLRVGGSFDGPQLFTLNELLATVVVLPAAAALGAAYLTPTGTLQTSLFSDPAAVPIGYVAADTSSRIDYALNVIGIPDGVYTFVMRNSNTGAMSNVPSLARNIEFKDTYGYPSLGRASNGTLVICRTPPAPALTAAMTLTPSQPLVVGAPSGLIAIPPTLFNTSIVAPAALLTLALASEDTRGFRLTGPPSFVLGYVPPEDATTLAAAFLTTGPGFIYGPPGIVTLLLSATDEAGNVGTASVDFTVLARPTSTMRATSSVGATNSSIIRIAPVPQTEPILRVNATFIPTRTASLLLVADFSVAVKGASASSIVCRLEKSPCGNFSVTAFDSAVPSDGGFLRYSWSVFWGATDVVQIVDLPPAGFNLSLDTSSIVDAITGVAAVAPTTILVQMDSKPPNPPYELVLTDDGSTPRGFHTPDPCPVVGVPYTYTLPFSLLEDAYSKSHLGGVSIVSYDPPSVSPFGIHVLPGILGSTARIQGTVAALAPRPDLPLCVTDAGVGYVWSGGGCGSSDPNHFCNRAGNVITQCNIGRLQMPIIVSDQAGNAISYPNLVTLPIAPQPSTGVPTLTLSEPVGIGLTFAKGGSPVYLDAGISFTLSPGQSPSDLIIGVQVRLVAPETALNGTVGVGLESLIARNPCPTRCSVTYELDQLTNQGLLQLQYLASNSLNLATDVAAGLVTLADVQPFLRSVQYSNTRTSIVSLTREIQVVVVSAFTKQSDIYSSQGVVAPYLHGVIASTSRMLKITPTNAAPIVILSSGASATWLQGLAPPTSSLPIPLLSTNLVNVSDTDDYSATFANVKVLTQSDGATYSGCDPLRDVLALASTYRGSSKLPRVYGIWYASSCTLVLRPVGPSLSVTLPRLVEALRAVTYTNKDPLNPTAWAGVPYSNVRRVEIITQDVGAGGILAPAQSANGVGFLLTLSSTPQPFVSHMRAGYAFGGGVFSSLNPFASLKPHADSDGVVYQSKFPLVLPAVGSYEALTSGVSLLTSSLANCTTQGVAASGGVVICTISIDLTADVGVNGSFAGGAFTSPDSSDPPTAAPYVTFVVPVVNPVKTNEYNNLVGGNLVGAAISSTPLVSDAYQNNFLSSTFVSVPQPGGAVLTSSFLYSATEPSTLTLVLNADKASADLGEFTLELVWTASPARALQFSVDVRVASCILSDATSYVGAAAIAAGEAYPDNSQCVYPPVMVDNASPDPTIITRGAYDAATTAMDEALAQLVALGASPSAQLAALTTLRSQARGIFSINIAAGSLLARGSAAIVAEFLSAASLALMPPSPIAGGVLDTAIAVHLGPSGLAFSRPVTICLFVGNSVAGTSTFLASASQLSDADESRGYGPLKLLTDATFSRPQGKVCGSISHFSIVVPITIPQPPVLVVPKAHLMGGSCPRHEITNALCSGQGYCRQEGSCLCYAGFKGIVCSQRVCPSGDSWGEAPSRGVSSAAGLRPFAECSGRGICQTDSGLCSCFKGYEGSACQLLACPKQIALRVDQFTVLAAQDGEAALLSEAEWEMAILAGHDPAHLDLLTPTGLTVDIQVCSGRGICRPVGEASAVAASRYTSWENMRVQMCVCDEGWFGPDCSQRKCPSGQDPEEQSLVAPTSIVQRITVGFSAYPTNAGIIDVDINTDALSFTLTSTGATLAAGTATTGAINHIWEGSESTADSIRAALLALPGFFDRADDCDVRVAAIAPPTPSSLTVSYDVTFTGNRLIGSEPLLGCHSHEWGDGSTPTMGCLASGCKPLLPQLRILSVPLDLPNALSLSPTTVLRQPPPVRTPGAGTSATPSVWGVSVTLVLNAIPYGTNPRGEEPIILEDASGSASSAVLLTYQWVAPAVYGTALGADELAAADWVREESMLPPPGELRRRINGPFGLLLDLDDDTDLLAGALGAQSTPPPWSFTFAWSLPTCSVEAQPLAQGPSIPHGECSLRGTCDHATGLCACFSGYDGAACSVSSETAVV